LQPTTFPDPSTAANPAIAVLPGGSKRIRIRSLFELLSTGFEPTGP
jgi:hypothetical protein